MAVKKDGRTSPLPPVKGADLFTRGGTHGWGAAATAVKKEQKKHVNQQQNEDGRGEQEEGNYREALIGTVTSTKFSDINQLERTQGVLLGLNCHVEKYLKNNMGEADSNQTAVTHTEEIQKRRLPSPEGLLVFAAWHQNIPLCRFLLRGKKRRIQQNGDSLWSLQAASAAWTQEELKSRFYLPAPSSWQSGDSLWSEAWDKDWPESQEEQKRLQFCSVRDELPKTNKDGLSFEKNADGIGVGATALHAATIARSLLNIPGCALIRLLLNESDADINALFGGDVYYGQTVLHIAAFNLDLELVTLLIAEGASVQAPTLGRFMKGGTNLNVTKSKRMAQMGNFFLPEEPKLSDGQASSGQGAASSSGPSVSNRRSSLGAGESVRQRKDRWDGGRPPNRECSSLCKSERWHHNFAGCMLRLPGILAYHCSLQMRNLLVACGFRINPADLEVWTRCQTKLQYVGSSPLSFAACSATHATGEGWQQVLRLLLTGPKGRKGADPLFRENYMLNTVLHLLVIRTNRPFEVRAQVVDLILNGDGDGDSDSDSGGDSDGDGGAVGAVGDVGANARQMEVKPALQELLVSLNLQQYASSFTEQGYDELNDVHGMGVEELAGDVGMKKGHARRLLKHLNQHRGLTSARLTESLSVPDQKLTIKKWPGLDAKRKSLCLERLVSSSSSTTATTISSSLPPLVHYHLPTPSTSPPLPSPPSPPPPE
jgi:hypothetical protein